MKALKNLRRKKMFEQGGRCFYCDLPMWDEAPDLCLPVSCKSGGLPKILQCTAEHLHPRSEGGGNTADNIVAACLYCNNLRHRRKRPMSPEAHRAHVRQRMAAGRWLAAQFGHLCKEQMRA
jgi:5-methylcytosine-specific restriction endonuclease McrA